MNIDEFVKPEEFDEFKTIDNFDNNTILKDRWDRVDEFLSTFYSKNIKVNRKIYDNLQSIFDWIKFGYNELDNYASSKDVIRLRNRIEDLKEQYGLEGYIGYELTEYSKKKRLKNRELLLALLMVEYYRQYEEQKKEEMNLFDEIVTTTYLSASIETINVLNAKDKKKKIRLLTVPEAFLLEMIGMSSFNGLKWYDYKMGNIGYNAKKLYETIIILMQLGKPLNIDNYEIKKILNKQEKAYLNIKDETPTDDYKNVFSGALDNQISIIVNRTILQAMKKQGCKKVQFVAVMDDKTTRMCESLDGQIFNINEMNVYDRYSAEDEKNVVYHTMGLETGANLPPINNHFHYCRSTIFPVR